jgi:hypothetical protein
VKQPGERTETGDERRDERLDGEEGVFEDHRRWL